MRKVLIIFATLLIMGNDTAQAINYSFGWSANLEPVEGYRICFGQTQKEVEDKLNCEETGKVTSYTTVRDFPENEIWLFALTAYNGEDESDFTYMLIPGDFTNAIETTADLDGDGTLDKIAKWQDYVFINYSTSASGLDTDTGTCSGSWNEVLVKGYIYPNSDLYLHDYDGDGEIDIMFEDPTGICYGRLSASSPQNSMELFSIFPTWDFVLGSFQCSQGATQQHPPSTPTGFAVTEVTSYDATFHWNASTGTTPIYKICYATSLADLENQYSCFSVGENPTGTVYINPDGYFFAVKSENSAGASQLSNIIFVVDTSAVSLDRATDYDEDGIPDLSYIDPQNLYLTHVDYAADGFWGWEATIRESLLVNIGIFSSTTGKWYFDNSGSHKWEGEPIDDFVENFGGGIPGVQGFKVDIDGNGTLDLVAFAPTLFDAAGKVTNPTTGGNWYVDKNNNERWDGETGGDLLIKFGGGIPNAKGFIVGNRIGILSTVSGRWYFDKNGNRKWDGEPYDEYVENFGGGVLGAQPLMADIDRNGTLDFMVFSQPIYDSTGKMTNPTTAGNCYVDNNNNEKWDKETGGDTIIQFKTNVPNAKGFIVDNKIGVFSSTLGEWYLDRNGNYEWDDEPIDEYVENFGRGVSGALPVIQ